jgi:hypothetical protein
MDEDDLEDLWRDYSMRPKQVYQGLTCDGWWQSNDPPLGLLELKAGCITLLWNCTCLSKWCNIPGDSIRVLPVKMQQDSDTAWLICRINYLAVGLYDSYVTDSALFFHVNSVTQYSPHVSAHTCSLHSPVSSLACQFAATACATVKQMSRYQKRRCNAGSTPTGSICSRPLNIAHKSDTPVNVVSYVVWSFPFSRVIKSRSGD